MGLQCPKLNSEQCSPPLARTAEHCQTRRAPDDTACRSLPNPHPPVRRLGKYTSIHIAGGSVLAVIWQCQAVLNPSQNSRPKQISVRGRRSAQANVLRVTHC